jgi:hypothetical protein
LRRLVAAAKKITRKGTPKDDRNHDITSGPWKSSIVLYLDLINITEIVRPSPYADVAWTEVLLLNRPGWIIPTWLLEGLVLEK